MPPLPGVLLVREGSGCFSSIVVLDIIRSWRGYRRALL